MFYGGIGMKQRKKSTLIVGGVILVLLLVYLFGTVYFTDHFFAGTAIDGVDCSMKKYDEVGEIFKEEIKNYELTIKEMNCPDEKISSVEAGMELVENYDFLSLTRNQKRVKWPVLCFRENNVKAEGIVKINELKTNKVIEKLKCMDDEGKNPSQNASPTFNGEEFVVKKEYYGNIADKEKTPQIIKKAIKDFEKEIVLEEKDCYLKPERLENDSKLKEACTKMNNYCKAEITYDMISHTEVVDKKIISEWVTCDDELNIEFDEKKVDEYMKEFGKKYDTVGTERSFQTPSGKNAVVSGGTYGWIINEKDELEELLKLILDGAKVTREPIYKQRAASHEGPDWGENYCEVDISAQHMWCVKSGNIAYECPVVTGRPNGHATPPGVYSVITKIRNATLIGKINPETGEPSYRTPVSFWMQVTNNGVGMHDAKWQPTFGGSWYLSHGSHGCINMSYSSAATLFELVYEGMPVIIHY